MTQLVAASPQVDKNLAQFSKTTDGFVNFVSRLGINPAFPQNTLTLGHYNFNLITRNRLQLEAAYRGSWVVGQIVDSVASDMTRAGINITTNEAAQNIPEIQAAFTKLQIWNSICDVTKWSRLYGGALGVLQIKGQKLDTPLDLETVSKGQFKGLGVYDRWQLNPDLVNLIEEGPEIGLPKYYYIVTGNTLATGDPSLYAGQIRVHHSRVFRMLGIKLPFMQAITEMTWGESVVERVWDRLISFDDTTLSTANLVDRAQLRMVGIEGLREIIAAGGQAYEGLVQMFEMVREYQTNEGITLLDKNDVYATNSYSFAGLPEVLLQFGQQVAGAAEIPLVRLFGQSPAGLNSTGESDIRMYYDSINAKQEANLRNPMEVILQVVYRSLFGVAPPEDLQFTFNPLWQMSDKDRADINKVNTETILAAYAAGAISRAVMMKELRGNTGDSGLFSNITDEEIEEAEFDEPPLPEGESPIAEGETTIPAVKSIDHASALKKMKRWLSSPFKKKDSLLLEKK